MKIFINISIILRLIEFRQFPQPEAGSFVRVIEVLESLKVYYQSYLNEPLSIYYYIMVLEQYEYDILS